MNPLSSLIQQRKKNKLMDWLNKPCSISANLVPLQNFVKRTAKGASYYSRGFLSDDHSVDTMSTWEDKMRIQNGEHHQQQQQQPSRIKQTVVFVSRAPPPSAETSFPSFQEDGEQMMRQRRSMEMKQRKSQKKNKVLMLLQLEQVTAARNRIREHHVEITREILRKIQRTSNAARLSRSLLELEDRIHHLRKRRRSMQHSPEILDLGEHYRKFDTCLQELEDRNEIMELEGFKQLVIDEVEERAEAMQKGREHLKLVHGQLMQKFIMDELVAGGLYRHPPSGQRQPSRESWNEWIQIDDDSQDFCSAVPETPEDGSEWIVCDF